MKKIIHVISFLFINIMLHAQTGYKNTVFDKVIDDLNHLNNNINAVKFIMTRDTFQGAGSFYESYFNKYNTKINENQNEIDALYSAANNLILESNFIEYEIAKSAVTFSNFKFKPELSVLSFDFKIKLPSFNNSIQYSSQINYHEKEALKRNFNNFQATKISISKGLNNDEYLNYIEFSESLNLGQKDKIHRINLLHSLSTENFFGSFGDFKIDTLYNCSKDFKYGYGLISDTYRQTKFNSILNFQTKQLIPFSNAKSHIIWGGSNIFSTLEIKKNVSEINVYSILDDEKKCVKNGSISINDVSKVKLSADGKFLFVAVLSKIIQFDISRKDFQVVREFATLSDEDIDDFELSLNGEFLCVGSYKENLQYLTLFSVPYRTELHRTINIVNSKNPIHFKFSSTSKMLFITEGDGSIKSIDLNNNALESTFFSLPVDVAKNGILRFDVDYFNDLVSVVDSKNQLIVYRVSNNEQLISIPNVILSKTNDVGSFVGGLRIVHTKFGISKVE